MYGRPAPATVGGDAVTVRELSGTPPLRRMYVRVVALGLLKRAGVLGRGNDLPALELTLDNLMPDRDHLAGYAKICGFRLGGTLPSTYPHVLAFPLALRLMTDRKFPMPLSGLVHVANRITQHRPIGVDEALKLRVRAEQLRPHRKGTQFDLVTEAVAGQAVVWREVSTFLRRGDDTASSGVGDGQQGDGEEQARRGNASARLRPRSTWRVEADVSPRYAAVSGDRNPHHLHPLLARMFGFPGLLAHGMWMKARCFAELEDRLPDRFVASVEFKRPLLLPATVTLATTARDGGWLIALQDAEEGTPHLTGSIDPLPDEDAPPS